ncbi:hypothetical protein CU098_007404 [Rhizopus stolonifer]|uniref:37S ribosomal protein S35, mitochondrial n=1 Tax=Rhizopus stolonifer TaxID=4846 RepID=A0A367IZK8_RHIST|nr:hypothetical protein CU098_007404 [Rhizopus stolonifer]
MQITRLCTTSPLHGINAYTTIARYTTCYSQRYFSLSAQRLNEKGTSKIPETETIEPVENIEPIEAEPIKISRRRRKFHKWMETQGHKYSRPSEGTTNYLAISPFPNNPLFQPRPPLSDATKQQMYDAFASDSQKWTVRKLASKHGVSLKRVEAILKLKSFEKEMETNGIVLQRKFAKGMENLMGVDKTIELLRESLADVFPNVSKPKFKTLPEDSTFGPKDAAKVLNRMPFKDLERRAIELEQAEFTLPKSFTNEETIRKTKKFIITDISA